MNEGVKRRGAEAENGKWKVKIAKWNFETGPISCLACGSGSGLSQVSRWSLSAWARICFRRRKKGRWSITRGSTRRLMKWEWLGKWIDSRGPKVLQEVYWRPKHRRIDFHLNALLEAGYVERRVFVVSNRPARAIGIKIIDEDFAGVPCFTLVGTNRIEVLARGSEMGRWEGVIRKADVPEGGK